MADSQFSSFEIQDPNNDKLLHSIDKKTGRDGYMEYKEVADELLSRIPKDLDYADYPTHWTNTSYKSDPTVLDSLISVQKKDGSGYASMTLESLRIMFWDIDHPIGTILAFTQEMDKNPSSHLKSGTWARTGVARCLVGAGSSRDDNGVIQGFPVGSFGGAYEVRLTADQNGQHSHPITVRDDVDGRVGIPNQSVAGTDPDSNGRLTTESTETSGIGAPHENMPPYEVVFFWKRVA